MKNIGIIVGSLQGGGAERCAADLSVIFSNNGYNVFIITDTSAGVKYEYCGKLINYNFFTPVSNSDNGKNAIVNKVNELRDIKLKYKIEISISFMQYANYLNILSKEDDKIILTTHSLNSEYAKFENSIFWSEKTFKELYQFADLITFPSDYCKNDWLEHYGDKNNITKTVYNPVHLMKVNETTSKENVVISIGRLHGIKRQWILLRAFKRVKELCPDSKLIILGDGELRAKLEAMVKELNIEGCVEMPGNVQNVQDYLEKAKVFALTSRYEAMPCAVLESLSAGVPVVALDIPGGLREELGINKTDKNEYPIVGENGIITPYLDEYSGTELSYQEIVLAEEINHLLCDDTLRNKLAKAALVNINKFTAQEIGRVWIEEIFENKLNRIINEEEFEKIRNKNFEDLTKEKDTNDNMYVSYYRLLEKWMILKERNINVGRYFEKHEIKKVIIYGLGKMAGHLLADLGNCGVDVVCAIDKAAVNKYGDFPIITRKADIPKADCVVVTPIYQFDEIKDELSLRTSNRIISLNEVIDDLM